MEFNWLDLLWLVVIPLVQQLIKLAVEKWGWVPVKWQNQLICLALTVVFGYAAGGFVGLGLPVWSGDVMQFIGDVLLLVGGAWAVVSAFYEVVWDKLFVIASKLGLRLATKDKLPAQVYG